MIYEKSYDEMNEILAEMAKTDRIHVGSGEDCFLLPYSPLHPFHDLEVISE